MRHDVEAFTQDFRVRYEECGRHGIIRASVYLRYLQELAFSHSAALGFPLSWYETQRLFWLVRRVKLVVHAPARYGDDLSAMTQVVGMRRIMARRHNTVTRASDGAAVATVDVDWIFTQEGRVPTRIPARMVTAFPSLEGTAIAPLALDEPPPPEGAERTPLRIRTSDCDAMGHANNPVYLDLFDDAVLRAGGSEAVDAHPRMYDLQYHAAGVAGTDLRDLAWSEGRAWHYRLESEEGELHAHGEVRPETTRRP